MSHGELFVEKRVYGKVEILRLAQCLPTSKITDTVVIVVAALSLTRELLSKFSHKYNQEKFEHKILMLHSQKKPHGHEARLRHALILDDVDRTDSLFLFLKIRSLNKVLHATHSLCLKGEARKEEILSSRS